MKNFAIIATILSVAAGTASAQDAAMPASDEFDSLVLLPADVAARVAELRAYGDRFETAIRLIEQEASKPAWDWGSCDHEGEQVNAAVPET